MYPTDCNPIFSLQFMIPMPDDVEEMYPANFNPILLLQYMIPMP